MQFWTALTLTLVCGKMRTAQYQLHVSSSLPPFLFCAGKENQQKNGKCVKIYQYIKLFSFFIVRHGNDLYYQRTRFTSEFHLTVYIIMLKQASQNKQPRGVQPEGDLSLSNLSPLKNEMTLCTGVYVEPQFRAPVILKSLAQPLNWCRHTCILWLSMKVYQQHLKLNTNILKANFLNHQGSQKWPVNVMQPTLKKKYPPAMSLDPKCRTGNWLQILNNLVRKIQSFLQNILPSPWSSPWNYSCTELTRLYSDSNIVSNTISKSQVHESWNLYKCTQI